MARLIGHLALNIGPPQHLPRRAARVLAIVAVVALLVGSLAPAWALGAEADSEGEGQGTAPPRLGNPEFEPGGAETVLESVPGSGVGEEVEEDEEAPVIETEPPQEVAVPEAASAAEEASIEGEVEVAPPIPPVAAGTAPATPEYAPSPAIPAYETSLSPTSQPVRNEAIVEPKGGGETAHDQAEAKRGDDAPPPAPPAEEPEPAAPIPTAPSPASPPTAVLNADTGRQGPVRIAPGRSSYIVHPGDCLWSIAAALLRPGADDARIEAEVERLWRMNAGRIGTGDPNLILVGTSLRLG